MRLTILAPLALLSACSTERELLELQLDRLQHLDANSQQVRAGIAQGSYDPARYDAYLAIDADVFERLFSELEGQSVTIDAGGRSVEINIGAFATEFRPGSPEISLSASAIDQKSGIVARLVIDARLVLIRDEANPDELTAKVLATRIVPDLSWGPLNFTKARFVRSLLELEVSKFTQELPGASMPLAKDFTFGSAAQVLDSGRIDTGNGSHIRGQIRIPSTLSSGRFAVENILFLENGVHIFANVEGL